MRAITAVLILIIGGGLGYGWHEVSPRVLGSAPLYDSEPFYDQAPVCGPKVAGSSDSEPDTAYFHPRFTPSYYLGMSYHEDFAEVFGQPSLWRMSSTGGSAIRFFRHDPDGTTTVTLVEIVGRGAQLTSSRLVQGDGVPRNVARTHRDLNPDETRSVRWLLSTRAYYLACYFIPPPGPARTIATTYDPDDDIEANSGVGSLWWTVEAVQLGEYYITTHSADHAPEWLRSFEAAIEQLESVTN